MKEPLVSVMMITYNHVPYITQAIEGVLRQNVSFPIELVIGEDCSTDGTREIVLEYQRQYPDVIRVVSSDKNVGMTTNAYRTTKACRGRYLAFCEGDDYWHHPDKLQKQADYLESHPECGLVFSSYDVYYVPSKKLIKDLHKHRQWTMPRKPNVIDFYDGGPTAAIATCTVMTRRTLSEQIIEADPYLHQSGRFLMGDAQHWIEVGLKAHVHYIAESLATYTVGEESATQSKDIKKMWRFGISGEEMFLYLCDKYKFPTRTRNTHEARWCEASLRWAFHSRNAELADEVRRRAKTFTWKDWLKYYGARNLSVYSICQIVVFLLSFFRKGYHE